MIHEAASGRDPVLFAVIKQNFDVEKAELTKKAHVFRLPCKHCPRKMTWWSKKGYTGLMEHLKTHLDEETMNNIKEEHARKRRRKSKDILEFMNIEKNDAFKKSICNFLLEKNMPLSFLRSEEFKNIKNADDLVSENTMRTYMKRMKHLFIEKIKPEVDLELFGLVIDGWTHQGYNFNGVYLCFDKMKKMTFRLLGVLPLEKETQKASDIVPFLKNLMNKFGLNESLLVAIVADNTNTNKKVCRDLETPFVGCLNHRLALGVRPFIKSETPLSEALDKVQLLFRKIKKSKKLTAALRTYTDKVVVLPNVTHWSGNFLMMKRYLDIWMFIAQIRDNEVKDLILDQGGVRTLEKHLPFLATCDRYTVALQNSKFNLGQGKKAVANLLRDVNDNDSLLKYLEDDADILAEFGAFETGVFKVYWEEEDKLDAAERTALARLVKDPSEEEAKTPPGDSVAAEVFSQLRKSKKKSIFADVRFIPATSCSIERLFSQCKLTFSDRRNRMMPVTLIRLAFLKMNKDEVMDHDIYVAMKNNIPGFDEKEEEEEEIVEQMDEENEEEERVDLTLEGLCSYDKEVDSDDEA
eukprot:augustus_masked-scaffold_2-processed-gene-25.51-mRNA-1 protein AED:0.37 eAED:0.40 QI:0/-1/0/1/-1/1/1/0/579